MEPELEQEELRVSFLPAPYMDFWHPVLLSALWFFLLSLVFYADELGSVTCGHPCLFQVDIEEEWLIFSPLC